MTSKNRQFLIGWLLAAAAVGGCTDSGNGTGSPIAPGEVPTWDGAVQAVLAQHCVSCHASPPTNNAPGTFRLDKYGLDDGGDGLLGAREMAGRIRARAVVQRTMPPPPTPSIPQDDQDILEAWVQGGAPRE
jgi:uncharacterized membrane protein